MSTMPGIIAQLPLSEIDAVVFYQKDEITTDLVCCDVEARGCVWTFHEEADGWDAVIAYLSDLPGFKSDWYRAVTNPAFSTNETVAYRRA